MENSIITRLALSATIVVAALSASGVALGGGLRPDDRAGVHGTGSVPTIASQVVRPDDRGGVRGRTPTTRQAAAVTVADGFDWAAAGAGAGGALGVIALGAAAAAVVKRSHRGEQAKA